MAYNPRISTILSIISRKRSVSVLELKERLGVSEVTVRKDLDFLESEGIILRTHGGATMAEDQANFRPVYLRELSNADEKKAIALAAKALVVEGEAIYLDAGTTCRLLARELREMNLQVVTNSLDVVNELVDAEGISLYCLGGSLRREARSLIGPAALEALRDMQIQSCFLGATGFSEQGQFSSQNTNETQIKRQVLKISRRRVILADSSKFGVSAFSIFARPGDVDVLVTDSGFGDAGRLIALGIEVALAEIIPIGEAEGKAE
jgi:DeoR/GlpR family transcriptional regulator of sugar metabolism